MFRERVRRDVSGVTPSFAEITELLRDGYVAKPGDLRKVLDLYLSKPYM